MGYYIQGPTFGKADFIINEWGAKLIIGSPVWPPPTAKALICVVQNPFFDAAAYAFDEDEFAAFNDPGDPRPRKWLLMSEAKAKELTKYPK